MSNSILITGATGSVGKEVYEKLALLGAPVVGSTRTIDKANTLQQKYGKPWVALDFKNPSTFDSALSGVRSLFLMRPPDISNVKKYIIPFIARAKEAGVEHVVFLSLFGIENNRFAPHFAIEKALKESTMHWTMLRPSFFMQNLSTTHRNEIRMNSEIFVPAGKGKTSFIDTRDIAEIASMTLTNKDHFDKAYELTGNQSLTYYEIADILSKELGRKITYRKPGIFRFVIRKFREKEPPVYILVVTILYTICRLGKAGGLTNTTEQLLNRKPLSFKQFAHDFRECWL